VGIAKSLYVGTGISGALNGTVGATTQSTGDFTSVTGTVSSGAVATYTASGANQSIYSRYIGGSPNVANVYVGTDSAAGGISGIGGGGLLWNVGNGGLAFGANNALAMSLSTTGALALKGASTSATGVGITFPATQSASTNANTLDDYEEGTWTPVDSSGASLSFTAGSAIYIKIGRFVLVQFYFTFPITASGANNLIGGLPFTVASNNNYCYGVGRLGTPSAIGTMQANAGGTDIQIYNSSNGIYANSQLSNGNVLGSVGYLTN
jgi:hypothetical protein